MKIWLNYLNLINGKLNCNFFLKNSKIKYSSNIIKYKIFNYKIHIYTNKKKLW